MHHIKVCQKGRKPFTIFFRLLKSDPEPLPKPDSPEFILFPDVIDPIALNTPPKPPKSDKLSS